MIQTTTVSLTLVVLMVAGAARAAAQEPAAVGASDTLVYVGTYTGGKSNSQGIYAFKMAPGSTALVPLGLAAETVSPSFIEIDPARGLLFAVNEVDEYDGKPTGSVSAFSIDRQTGKLTLINRQPTEGKAPCHLALDKSGRVLVVANYTSGTVTMLPVASDGRLGTPTAVIQHTGSSVNAKRQSGPHAHCTTFDPAHRLLFACDLGLDKVMIYRPDADNGTLTAHSPAFATVPPGSGPRHMEFRPDGRFAYVLNEMTSTVTTFAYDAKAGALTERQTVSALPASFSGSSSGAEIAVHPSGKFVYSSNRGHNSVSLFRVDPANGTLTFVEARETGGSTPRNFAIDPTGGYLFAANQGSGTLLVFTIDQATGLLKPAGEPVAVPTPVCVRFLPPRVR
jgi:6-phosphogluconolactonase